MRSTSRRLLPKRGFDVEREREKENEKREGKSQAAGEVILSLKRVEEERLRLLIDG